MAPSAPEHDLHTQRHALVADVDLASISAPGDDLLDLASMLAAERTRWIALAADGRGRNALHCESTMSLP